MTVMTREALFEAAWRRPLTELAAELGVSDVGLRKICDRHDIPTPGRGYWAQVRAGKSFPRPKLRPVRDARLEQVQIAGGQPLSPVVTAAIEMERRRAPARAARSRPRAATASAAADAAAPMESVATSPVAPAPMAPRAELAATVKALAKARPDREGFVAVAGRGVVPMRIGLDSQGFAMAFLAALLAACDVRGWRLVKTDTGAHWVVDGETLAVRIDETPQKTAHQPTPKELAEKVRRDRWGGDHQTWPTWDLSPSGKLAVQILANEWSGLRRKFGQRKGFTLLDNLPAVLEGLAGHAAYTAEARRKAEIAAREAAIAEAQRKRLAAFEQREKHRAMFADAVAALLAERARLAAVLAHLEAQPEEARVPLAKMETWLHRRLKTTDARLDPASLEVSARYAKVDFAEPPAKPHPDYWYPREVALHIWRPDPEEDLMRTVPELDWAIAEGLIADPRQAPTPASGGAEKGETNAGSETSD